MATALALTAQSTIINGQGLAANAAMVTSITTFKNLPSVNLVNSIFVTSANVGANALPAIQLALGQLGSGVTKGQFLLDFWASNITPVSSGTVTKYGSTSSTSSMINTLNTQVALPFANGLSGFANVYQTSYGFAAQSFDTVGSTSMLKGKTIAQSGIGYTGVADLATGGIGSNGQLLGNVIGSWGTMYDISNLNLFADPYVFGQNLLNQGLGTYGNLSVNLTAAGLDTADITKIPATVTTTSQQSSSITRNTVVGDVELPTLTSVSSTNVVTGGSTDVIMSIYKQVKGADLQAIVSATGITGTSCSTLADFLDFDKVVPAGLKPALATINIRSLTDVGNYLNGKFSQATFRSWAAMDEFLKSIEVPVLNYSTSSADSLVISDSTISTVTASVGSGTGAFGNPVLPDLLGATSGLKYTDDISTIVSNYSRFSSSVISALSSLLSAVNTYVASYVPPDEFGSGESIPSIAPVANAVTAVNNALNSIQTSNEFYSAQTAYLDILTRLSTEVANLTKAGVAFGPGTAQALNSFASSVIQSGSDKEQFQTYQVITSLITHDSAGDTIRAAISEKNNIEKLSSVGISVHNDPAPGSAIYMAKSQNIPLTTYLSQNK
jgi:hypothetical protein